MLNFSRNKFVPSADTTIKLLGLIFLSALSTELFAQKQFYRENLDYCARQASKTLQLTPADTVTNIPRAIFSGEKKWHYVDAKDWVSGFWPGALWYLFEGTHDLKWKNAAKRYTAELTMDVYRQGFDHDLGFMIYNSFGNGYRLTKDPQYKKIVLTAADSLATLFNPKVGTILSWPQNVKRMGWPHNTIIDNMINLELLFWASKNGGRKELYDIAVSHAKTTMKNHFRPDYSSYHVVVYDTISGKKIKGITHQGYSDSSMWARGQSWAIYGYTMCYRETKDPEFLAFAQKVAEVYLKNLPKNLIPYWDFNAPGIPDAPRDASAAAVTSSALFELSTLTKNKVLASKYRSLATRMLKELSSSNYQSRGINPSFLLHSTGHHPKGSEIDASIIYADYYYLEALLRYEKIKKGLKLSQNL